MKRVFPLLALVAVLTACGQTPVPAAGPRPGPDDLALPIDAYALTVPDLGRIGEARAILIERCLRREDAGAVARARRSARNLLVDLGFYGNKRRYGLTSATEARRYGYHLRSVVEGTAVAAEPKAGQREARCAREANAAVAGPAGTPGEAEVVARISRDSFRASTADPALRSLFEKWSRCMVGKGFRDADLTTVAGPFDLDDPSVAPEEIATAAADVACKRRHRLAERWHQVESALQQGEIARHARELAEARADRDARMRRVARVLANP